MKAVLTRNKSAIILVLFVALPACVSGAFAEDNPVVDRALVQSYLEKAGGTCKLVGTSEIHSQARAAGVPYKLLVKTDPGHFLVYLAIDDLFVLKPDHPQLSAITEKMARLNFDLALGKLEWDAQSQRVRLSYSFSTEDGLGYSSFRGVLVTLLQSAGPVRKALAEAAEASDPPQPQGASPKPEGR